MTQVTLEGEGVKTVPVTSNGCVISIAMRMQSAFGVNDAEGIQLYSQCDEDTSILLHLCLHFSIVQLGLCRPFPFRCVFFTGNPGIP